MYCNNDWRCWKSIYIKFQISFSEIDRKIIAKMSSVSMHVLINRYWANRNCLGQFRGIPVNQTSDVHRGSTLITWRYITWRWRYIMPCQHNSKCDYSKINGFKWSSCFFNNARLCINRYGDILLKKKNMNFIYYVDKTFGLIKIMDFDRPYRTHGCYSSIFPYASFG